MDIALQWGVLRYLLNDIQARRWVPVTAIILNLLVLGGFIWVKFNSDPFVIGVALVTMFLIAISELMFLRSMSTMKTEDEGKTHKHH